MASVQATRLNALLMQLRVIFDPEVEEWFPWTIVECEYLDTFGTTIDYALYGCEGALDLLFILKGHNMLELDPRSDDIYVRPTYTLHWFTHGLQ